MHETKFYIFRSIQNKGGDKYQKSLGTSGASDNKKKRKDSY